MNDYSMYRYYKGEIENPFNLETENTSNQFWFYEAHFEHIYTVSDEYKGKNKKQALNDYLDKLFPRLADKYDCFDGGQHFRTKYNIG